MLRRNPSAAATMAILMLGLLSAGCSGSGAAPMSPGASVPAAGPSAAAPTVGPTETATTPTPPTEQSTAPSFASPLATATTAAGGPPAAALRVEGGDPVTGQLGSYTWAGGGSDSPWLPGAPIRVGTGERLSLSLAPATKIGPWLARQAATGTLDGAGAVSLGEGSGAPIVFRAPGPGMWSVQLTIRFADDLGSATYYWQVEVR